MDFFTAQSHAYRSIFLFIYAFHMPLFLFVSGLFHREDRIIQKCIFYVTVGFSQKMLFFVTNVLLGNQPNFVLLGDNGIPWFMFVLAIYTALTYALRNANKKYILLFFIALGCFVGYDTSIGDYLYLSRGIIFYPAYLLGTMIKQEKIIEVKEKHKSLAAAAIAVLLFWAYLCYVKQDNLYVLRPLFTGRNPFGEDLYPYGALVRLLCYAITFFVGAAILFVVPSKKILGMSGMGSHSVDVYFWHWPVWLLLNHFFCIGDLVAYRGGQEKFCF